MASTTCCVNLDGPTCHAPHAPTPSEYSDMILLSDFLLVVEMVRRDTERAAKVSPRCWEAGTGREASGDDDAAERGDAFRSADDRLLFRCLANTMTSPARLMI
jgi:hypothetical protein